MRGQTERGDRYQSNVAPHWRIIELFAIEQTTTPASTTTESLPANHSVSNWSALVPGRHRTTTPPPNPVCGHIFTTYILPDVLHLFAFIIGFMYFRVTEGEPIYSLMEKVGSFLPLHSTAPFPLQVFIRADHKMRQLSQNRVIRRLKSVD